MEEGDKADNATSGAEEEETFSEEDEKPSLSWLIPTQGMLKTFALAFLIFSAGAWVQNDLIYCHYLNTTGTGYAAKIVARDNILESMKYEIDYFGTSDRPVMEWARFHAQYPAYYTEAIKDKGLACDFNIGQALKDRKVI